MFNNFPLHKSRTLVPRGALSNPGQVQPFEGHYTTRRADAGRMR